VPVEKSWRFAPDALNFMRQKGIKGNVCTQADPQSYPMNHFGRLSKSGTCYSIHVSISLAMVFRDVFRLDSSIYILAFVGPEAGSFSVLSWGSWRAGLTLLLVALTTFEVVLLSYIYPITCLG
jgi:hypothetical protein